MGWTLRTPLAAVFAALLLTACAGRADDAAAGVASQRVVHRFDFDERPLGNYEDLPMHWTRLTGDGLPPYSAGAFDDNVGHGAPPSLRFEIWGGSAACEYAGDELHIDPGETGGDYLLEAFIRCTSLRSARAFVECALLDPAGQLISGSERISTLVGGDSDWQRVEVPISVDDLSADRVRVRLWVLQRYVWDEPAAADPITRQDVRAQAWFDDITLFRVPRLRLKCGGDGGIVRPDEAATLHVDIHNSTPDSADVEITVADALGRRVHEARDSVDGLVARRVDVNLPTLPSGLYTATAALRAAGDTMLERSLRFAVLPKLPFASTTSRDVGATVTPWMPTSGDELAALIAASGVGAAKLELPVIATGDAPPAADHWELLRRLVRRLSERDIEAIGVLRTDAADSEDWRRRADELFVRCAGFLHNWQVGDDTAADDPNGTPRIELLRTLSERLTRLVGKFNLVVPGSLMDEPAATTLAADAGAAASNAMPAADALRLAARAFHLPSHWPASAVPWQLAGWQDAPPSEPGAAQARWLTVDCAPPALTPDALAEQRIEFARRVVLSKVLRPDRLYVPAPIACSTASGAASWQPTELFIPTRTLLTFIGGANPTAVIPLPRDAIAVLFRGGSGAKLVVWTWRADAADDSIDLALGDSPSAWTLDGETVPLESDDGRCRVPLRPEPLLIEPVDAGLLQLDRGFAVQPAVIQQHDPDEQPTLTFANAWSAPLSGVVELTPPDGWTVDPKIIPFELAPGEVLRRPLRIGTQPHELSAPHVLETVVRIWQPVERILRFRPELRVDLTDIRFQTECWRDGEELVIEQRLTNLSGEPVRFSAFCQLPDRPRLEGVFLDVAPGDTGVQRYRVPKASELSGSRGWAGIREVHGDRTLDQAVSIPE